MAIIYKLIWNNVVVYVGKSTCENGALLRIGSHKDSKRFDSYTMETVPDSDAYKIECEQIVKLMPIYNKNLPKNDTHISASEVHKRIKEYIYDFIIDSGMAVVFHGRKRQVYISKNDAYCIEKEIGERLKRKLNEQEKQKEVKAMEEESKDSEEGVNTD